MTSHRGYVAMPSFPVSCAKCKHWFRLRCLYTASIIRKAQLNRQIDYNEEIYAYIYLYSLYIFLGFYAFQSVFLLPYNMYVIHSSQHCLDVSFCQSVAFNGRSRQGHLGKRRGRAQWLHRAPDCLASHACVPVSNPIVPVWGFLRSSIVSPFSMWLGDHVNGGLVELRLTPLYRR